MKLIAVGDIYDLPPYAECDLDALIEWRYAAYKQHHDAVGVPGLIADAFTAAFSVAAGLFPDSHILPKGIS